MTFTQVQYIVDHYLSKPKKGHYSLKSLLIGILNINVQKLLHIGAICDRFRGFM